MKTRDKIIVASIELFNEKGERNITTNHIAAHLGISPGNLYYHFRNKEDIINAIYNEYADDLITQFKGLSDTKNPLDSILLYMDIVFQLISKFRFFYSNLPVLLSKNPALKKRYSEIQRQIIKKVSTMLKSLDEAEILSIKEDELDDLTCLLRITTTFWLSYLQTQVGEDPEIDDASLYEGLLKIFALLSPYVTDKSRADFETARSQYKQLKQQALDQQLAVNQ
ncbi:TetR/AcrR family transcriptional regulator [Thalassotalea sp. ND16A]|uniref:TetR/AcrR family transcriptional regulator n=1 Tax=Thalassotalea sp. ND16A TaxID=1535422 RepID=UPI00051A7749|nr:TetR/AcrR family transcriptional regulator [Thalassotalea sp. ND16A]KGJ92196.1 putative transcriptional regulator, TetR family [Thalassotalea sp. ND16A]